MGQALQQQQIEPNVIWEVGSEQQSALISCPFQEIFFGGSRGGGKTEGCIGDWLAHQEVYGKHAKGIFLRHTLVQLEQVIERAEKVFAPIAEYKAQKKTFIFHNGATLKFRYLDGIKDAENYQGHEYTRIYPEELTNWPDPAPIDMLRACLRSSEDILCKMIATGNPGGVGHTWVKHRYIDIDPRGYKPVTEVFDYEGEKVEMTRVFIPSRLENNHALKNKATYVAQLHQVGSPELVRAWLDGDWDIVAGAYLEGVWDAQEHVVTPFDIKSYWTHWRSMDWGTFRPYSIGWYAMSPEGIIYRYRELYGWGGKPNKGTGEVADEVASKIRDIEEEEIRNGVKFQKNIADSSMWNNVGSELSVNDHFRSSGVKFIPSKKGANSRVNGAHEIVSALKDGRFKVFSNCEHFLRTVPAIPRSTKNPDDVDTDAEDHVWDEVMYSLVSRQKKAEIPKGRLRHRVVDVAQMRHKPINQKRYTLQ